MVLCKNRRSIITISYYITKKMLLRKQSLVKEKFNCLTGINALDCCQTNIRQDSTSLNKNASFTTFNMMTSLVNALSNAYQITTNNTTFRNILQHTFTTS